MKQSYERATLTAIMFEAKDIITTSPVTDADKPIVTDPDLL